MEKIEISAAEFIRLLTKGGTPQNPEVTQYVFNRGEIKYVKVAETIRMSGITIDQDIDIADCEIQGLYIKDCIFEKGLNIERTDIGHFNIDNTEIGNSFSFGFLEDPLCKIDYLRIYKCHVKNDFIISKTMVEDRVSFFYLTVDGFLSVYDCNIKKEFSISNVKTGDELVLQDSQIGFLDINFIPEKMVMKILNVFFSTISCEDFTNQGYLQWNNLMPISGFAKIELRNAIMGKWDIVNCDFSKTNTVIYSSKITDAFYTNTKFSELLSLPEKIKKSESPHDILRDGYNQVKTLAQKQNDRKMFLHYQAAELRSYFKSIYLKEKPLTQIQLIAMWLSNNYGTSWGRGVLFVCGLNLIFLVSYLSNHTFNPTHDNIVTFIANYLDLMLLSLVKKPDFMIGNRGTIIFGISRIFIAFGIYQTIAAFRKFGKSE